MSLRTLDARSELVQVARPTSPLLALPVGRNHPNQSRCAFDKGLYSEPMAVLNLLDEYVRAFERPQPVLLG